MFPENFFEKNAKNLIICILFIIAGLAVYKHKSSPSYKDDSNYEQFSGLIESYTTGIISRQSTVQVRLAADVQTLHAKK